MIQIEVAQKHIDVGIKLGTADPLARAIKEKFDRRQVPEGYIRVDRVVTASSAVWLAEHCIFMRKGKEEVDLFFEKYLFGPKSEFYIHDPAFDFIHAFDNGRPVKPTQIEITEIVDARDSCLSPFTKKR